jgi:putative phage-type endonuclease
MNQQRTEEWFQARLGKVTASKISDVIARTKTGYSASRANYMAQLIVERLTNQKQESYTNSAMEWGTQQEPFARAEYEAMLMLFVEETGFVDHPFIPMAGASPDGLVSDDGLVEIKCPNTATHIETILSKKIDQKYINQMQWQMACTNRLWTDFVSYDPRLPKTLQLFVMRVLRDNEYILSLEAEVHKFLIEVEEKVNQLNNLRS